jgi:hypothetical protein
MNELINKTKNKAKLWIKQFPKSSVLWSGGKDSTTLLHLLKFGCGIDLPVVQFREPNFRERYEYSDKLIKQWDLEVHEYPPLKVSLTDGIDTETGEIRFDLLKYYQWGKKCVVMSLGTERPIGNEKYLCGLDFLSRPTGNFNWPWTAVFIGTKNCDVDLIKGQIPPSVDIRYSDGSPVSLYLLRDWTDENVYQYLEENGVMADGDRYEKIENKWQNKKDKSKNADYIPTCLNCIDRHADKYVYCPKLKAQITNMSEKAPYEDIEIHDLGLKKSWQADV